MKRIRLSKAEIESLLIAAGAADPVATFEDVGSEKEQERAEAAFESAVGKLQEMLERKAKP